MTRGSLLGWPVEALIAAAAWLIGYGTAGSGRAAARTRRGAGGRLRPRDPAGRTDRPRSRRLPPRQRARSSSSSGVLLIRAALAGTPTQLEELVSAALFIGLGGVVAFLVAEAEVAGASGGEVLGDAPDGPIVHATRTGRAADERAAAGAARP